MRTSLLLLTLLLAGCVSTATAPDLYTSVQDSRATADAALQQAHYQGQFLTATAEAPIVRITETAAAMVVQQQYWTSTAAAVAGNQTATALAWTPTPNATQTAAFMALNAQSTSVALELIRQEKVNETKAITPYLGYFIIILVLAIVLVWIARRERFKAAAVDARGNLLPVFDYVQGVVVDPDRMPNYRGNFDDSLLEQWIREKLNLPPLLPDVTAERQDSTTQRDQFVDLASRGLPGLSQSPQKERQKIAAQEMAGQLTAQNLKNRYRILDGATSNLEVIDGEIIQVLDQDWKKEGGHDTGV